MMGTPLQGLSQEETGLFLEIFESSLRINQREQLFSWLQGSFQSLLPHEVLLCGMQMGNQSKLQFESFIATRYVTDQHISLATQDEHALISRAIKFWRHSQRPILVAEGLSVGDFGLYAVPFTERLGSLQEIELRNIAAHGIASKDGEVQTFFCFSRIPGQLGARHAYLLELLVPHLHAVMVRIAGLSYKAGYQAHASQHKSVRGKRHISRREHEVMRWMNQGKTNLEIAAILAISPLTVKNHVHSILRKLGVENRSNACVKAAQLGLLKI